MNKRYTVTIVTTSNKKIVYSTITTITNGVIALPYKDCLGLRNCQYLSVSMFTWFKQNNQYVGKSKKSSTKHLVITPLGVCANTKNTTRNGGRLYNIHSNISSIPAYCTKEYNQKIVPEKNENNKGGEINE